MVVLFGSTKEAMNLLDTIPTAEDQHTDLELLFGESRRLCVKAIETQTVTELLLRKSYLLLEETKRLHKVLQSTITRTDQLCRESLELQIASDYLLDNSRRQRRL
jgi:hypothetical protein